jgi:iron complex transport system ATP-binding protein
MLARALVQDTPVIILDEPTAHLDLPNRITLMRLLHQLAKTTGKGILLSTHDLDLALQSADEVWLQRNDGMFTKGAPEDIVLNGTFEAAFHKEGFVFDKGSGTFIIHSNVGKPIRVTGEGAPLFWTKRALLREGFAVTADAAESIHIMESGNTWQWRYRNESHATIAALLLSLRNHYGIQ